MTKKTTKKKAYRKPAGMGVLSPMAKMLPSSQPMMAPRPMKAPGMMGQ